MQEYCDGGTLKDALDGGRFADPAADPASGAPGGSLVTAVRVALEIACGMTYIHNRSIIHGDLKPGGLTHRGKGRPLVPLSPELVLYARETSSAKQRRDRGAP